MDAETFTLSADILAATEMLAATLASAEPVATYHQAKKNLEANAQATDLLNRFSAAQTDLRVRQSRGTLTKPDMDRLRAMQREVQTNPLIMEYARTQQIAMAYLPEINQDISQLIGLDYTSLASGPGSC